MKLSNLSTKQITAIVTINQSVQNMYKGCFLPTTANFLDDILEKKQYLCVSIKKNTMSYPSLCGVVDEEKAQNLGAQYKPSTSTTYKLHVYLYG